MDEMMNPLIRTVMYVVLFVGGIATTGIALGTSEPWTPWASGAGALVLVTLLVVSARAGRKDS